jgi:hypothetical protein
MPDLTWNTQAVPDLSGKPFTTATFRVAQSNHEAFKLAWVALCTAFQRLPRPPAGAMTLVQSADDPEVFLSLGPWHTQADIEAMRVDPGINILMSSMMALCRDAMRGVFVVIKVIPDNEETLS